MRKSLLLALCLILSLVALQSFRLANAHADSTSGNWLQWAHDAQHNGYSSAVGVVPTTQLAYIPYDPFVAQAKAESFGALLAHYQVPLVDGDHVFIEYKTGAYTSCNPPGSMQPYPCGPDSWNQEIWNERAYQWQNGKMVRIWNFQSDWKPEPNSNAGGRNEKQFGLSGWEPVFHAAVGNGFVYVPGFSGTIHKVRESDGRLVETYAPFGNNYANVFVASPLTLDAAGNVYYNALALDNEFPWSAEPRGSWLVKISPEGVITKATYANLIPDAVTMCEGGLVPCGDQRASINVAPAISPDGKTVYTVSHAQFIIWSGYLIAANTKDLSPKWDTYLFGKVAPGTALFLEDVASSTPVVTPDGSILFGAVNATSRGFTMKFSPTGQYLTSFDFGWDSTPAVYPHDGTYSVIIKNNYYLNGGPYYITRLNADMVPEWSFKNDTTNFFHPNGYEWCVNAPAVDANGTVYANSEDGNLYVIDSTGKLKGKIMLKAAVASAYTPVAVGPDGKIYAENDGDLFVVGQ